MRVMPMSLVWLMTSSATRERGMVPPPYEVMTYDSCCPAYSTRVSGTWFTSRLRVGLMPPSACSYT